MAFVFTLPDDPYYDYLPIDGPDITVGMDILGIVTSEGTVTSITPSGGVMWSYILSVDTAWGSLFAWAFFPDDPDAQPNNWWQRIAMWTRDDRLPDRTQMTVPDGSRWIYSAGGDGQLVCHKAGSTYARGRRLFRGQLTTDPRDLVAPEDTEYDWLPVKDGATVAEDDYVQFAMPSAGIVDDIVSADLTDGYARTEISSGGSPIGFYDVVTDPAIQSLKMVCYFYQRVLKPVIYTSGVGADGSEWVYSSGSVYFCYKPGTVYSPGAIFPRGQIELTDLPSTAGSEPPLIREVLQTTDGLLAAETLTTGTSTIAGDVLLIIYATTTTSASTPTSTAGTVTQVGTDATDGDGDGLLRVYRCPVGSDGAQDVSIPAAGGFDVMAAVLVLTADADVDGFGKTSFDPSVFTATLPSVSPTGDADLLVGVYFNKQGRAFDLSLSGLIERAAPKCLPYAALAVGTLELESSSPTAAAYPATMPDEAKPATVAVAMIKP